MSEAEKPKQRRLWQIHLSSLLAFTLCLGAMLGLNLLRRFHRSLGPGVQLQGMRDYNLKDCRVFNYGWPFRSRQCIELEFPDEAAADRFMSDSEKLLLDPSTGPPIYVQQSGQYVNELTRWIRWPIFYDAFIGVAICAAVVVLFEYLIRRREGSKQ